MCELERLRVRRSPGAVLLRRRDGDLQVGLGTDAVLLSDPERHWHQLLDACRGSDDFTDLLAASPLPTDLVLPVFEDLLAYGLVEAAEPVRRPPLRARLVGAGAVGSALARVLPGMGFTTVYVHDPSPPDAELYPHASARHQAEALCAGLDVRRFRAVQHWSKPAGVEVSLTVVCSATIEADRGVADDLVRADQPHLIIRPLPSGAVVGPLVVPGRTACLRCCDLRQRDLDDEWPMLLHQLTRERAEMDQVTRAWAVALAAVQIRGFLADQRVDTESGTLELSGREQRQVWRSWPPHPECGCQW